MDKKGRVNLAPFSYFNALSADPPMVVFGPNAKNDEEAKDSYRNVLEVPEFVVNIVSRTERADDCDIRAGGPWHQ